jgi:hypothetical protein
MDSIQSNEVTTSFMGVTLSKEGPTDVRITKALNSSGSLLDILKFIEVTEFDLNKVMFDYFWQVMVGNTRSHLGPRVLEWFGYEGDIKVQKRKFIEMLKRNNISYNELTQKDKEIEHYPTITNEISLLPSNVTNSKFLIMEPKDIKMAIMQLKTKNGHIIRQYYIDLEDLMKLYVEYTLAFNERRSLYKIESLEKMMEDMRLCNERQEKILAEVRDQNENLKESLFEVRDQNEILINQNGDLNDKLDNVQGDLAVVQDKLEISVEDRCPKVRTTNRLEQFVLLKKNKRGDRFPYYVICGQHVYVSNRLTLLNRRFPSLETLLRLEYQPNTKNLFGRFKETYRTDVVVKMNDIQLVTLNEAQLIDAFVKLDEEKANVGEE